MEIENFITRELIEIIRREKSFDKQEEVITFLNNFVSPFNKYALEYIRKELKPLKSSGLEFFLEVIELILAIEDNCFDRTLLYKSEELLDKYPGPILNTANPKQPTYGISEGRRSFLMKVE